MFDELECDAEGPHAERRRRNRKEFALIAWVPVSRPYHIEVRSRPITE